VIEFQHVGKDYPDGTRAVGDVSLSLEAGTCTVLVGSSGSGKTTLLRMVNRMVDPSRGAVLVGGHNVQERNPVQLRREIGYVMQGSGLLPHRTVLANVETVPLLRGESKQEAKRRALLQLKRVGLDPLSYSRYPGQLSGGQQQRVGVARALAADPDILLMDEPFGAVDPLVRAELQAQLRALQDELKKTILFVTHDMDEALLLADRIVVLRPGGEIAQDATPQEIVAAPADDFVRGFLGLDTAQRALRLEAAAAGDVVLDRFGRPLGIVPRDQRES
jgi:osmoprotectant transport system ATP-binding protein